MATTTDNTSTITIQVPESAIDALRPLEGVLRMTGHDVDGVLRDRLTRLADDIMRIAETADATDPGELREIATDLQRLADAFEAVT
jgi:hypothetical protein